MTVRRSRAGSVLAWYRFLGARTAEDAKAEVGRHRRALEEFYAMVYRMWGAFKGCPDDDLETSLWTVREALGDALDGLDRVWHQLDSVQRNVS